MPLQDVALSGDLPLPIPDKLQEVTAEYMQCILQKNRVIDEDLEIMRISCTRIGENTGFNSHCGLFEIEYRRKDELGVTSQSVGVEHSESRNPISVVVKLMPPPEEAVLPGFLLARFWEAEICIMCCLNSIPLSQRFPHPLCHFAAIRKKDKGGHSGIIIMSTIVSLNPGQHIVPLTLRQARSGVKVLARFHAAYWCGDRPVMRPHFPPLRSKLKSITSRETGLTSKYIMETGGYRDILMMPEYKPVKSLVIAFCKKILAVVRDLREGPYTISHGDVRSENFFFSDSAQDGENETDSKCVISDFQFATICNPVRDLTGFIMLNLDVDERREWFSGLLTCYHEELARCGIKDFSMENSRKHMPGWLLWPLLMDIGCAHSLRLFFEEYKSKTESEKQEGSVRFLSNEKHRARLFAALEDFKVEEYVAQLKSDPDLPFFGCCCVWACR